MPRGVGLIVPVGLDPEPQAAEQKAKSMSAPTPKEARPVSPSPKASVARATSQWQAATSSATRAASSSKKAATESQAVRAPRHHRPSKTSKVSCKNISKFRDQILFLLLNTAIKIVAKSMNKITDFKVNLNLECPEKQP